MTDPLSVPPDPDAQEEDRFVRNAVRAIADPRLPFPSPPPGGLWMERARRHGVLSSLDAGLIRAGHTASAELGRYRGPRAVRQLVQRHDLALVAGVLDRAGVEWVVIKGPVLGDLVFEHRGSRESSDLDILVGAGHLRTAESALRAAGLTRLGVDWTQRTWARGAEVPMQTPSGTIVDLHWHLINRPGMRRVFRLSTADLLARRTSRVLAGVRVWTLDDLDVVLHTLLHACLDGCGRWRALLDSQQCLRWLGHVGYAPTDLADRAASWGVQAPVWVAMRLVSQDLDAESVTWSMALERVTWWCRVVEGRSRRASPLDHGSSRRLVRYTAPTTRDSIWGVIGYGWSRIVRIFSPDDTSVSERHGLEDDPSFERFLNSVEAV